ncbi:hypothetical protein D8674_034193 [Pyrus ussuriensis x Pyrus communis]|uniref:Uncharacterized protein n=1 Tax=Pyrus ussuriensis x Pyrus communis TaxID=2448454 RepID=A0A5N5HP91_9ROSA|nr:hypothetical protein D8674_034193 [Pyrus ussuriensis x Pyrus communis]
MKSLEELGFFHESAENPSIPVPPKPGKTLPLYQFCHRLKRHLESLTNPRRWEIGAAERQGKGRGTASYGKDFDDSDDEDHDDGNKDGDAV